ncbi:MAG: penicillin-binding protein 2 [Coriobacteriales bacterium]|jgi:cell division protein FtsI (penicillin-binding protein 3)|nr:penicillin-binding protein 2 [Coriobacteriales bacterium]
MPGKKEHLAPDRAKNALGVIGSTFAGRGGAILLVFVLLAIWTFARLFSLTVVEAKALSEEGSGVRTTSITLTAHRGTMYDRNGNVLATDVDAVTIYANPSKIVDPKKTSELLEGILGGSAKDYYAAITEDSRSTFVYLAKKVDIEYEQAINDASQEYIEEKVAAIRAEGDDVPAEIVTPFTGIEFLPDMRREYPKGSTGAQIIGAVNDEGIGMSGLEATYDCILRGIDGRRVVEEAKQISQNSRPLPMIDSVLQDVEPVAGSDIIISIDIETQQFLELNLQAVAAQRKCNNASSILLDGSTGDIIAAASIPLYDRETITSEQVAQGATNAKAITQPYEPGSTFKGIIAAVALEHDVLTADEAIYCPPYLEIYDQVVKDSVDRDGMDMTLRQIIAHSSNIGVSLIEEKVGDELYYEYLKKLGLGEYTHVDYPGETPGTLAEVQDWTPIQAANITFGQGLEVTLLQMASIYGAFSNDGVMMQPHFLLARPQYDIELQYGSKRVFDAQTTRDLEEILRSCVTDGYGYNAAVEGYDAVGKTGTAEIGSFSGGYETTKGSYVCSFVGYLDNSTSNYVFMSSFENPINYADSPATKFFSVVMTFVANRYMIQPQVEAPAKKEVGAVATVLETETSQATVTDESYTVESKIAYPTPRAGTDWVLDTSG